MKDISVEQLIQIKNRIITEPEEKMTSGSFNHGSVKILNRFNFYPDGKLRRHHKLNDEYFDEYLFSILKNEYTILKNKNEI